MSLKRGLIAGLLLISIMTNANGKKEKSVSNEYLEVTVTPNQYNNVLVHIYKQNGEKVRIKIYDQFGKLIYRERVSESREVLKPYDLSELPLGKYTFEVSNDVNLTRKVIETR